MAETFELEIATPERLLIHEPVSEAQIPLAEDMIGVLPDHAPLPQVDGGQRRLRRDPGQPVRVLADRAERGDEIDLARAEAALKRAADRLAAPAGAGVDLARA